MDWNWFFSTLAQSSAAIVGLMGAFLVSAIISRENEFQRLSRDYDQLLEEIQFEGAKISNLSIDWYNRERSSSVHRSDLYEELVLKRKEATSIDKLNGIIAELDFSPYEQLRDIQGRVTNDLGTYHKSEMNISMPPMLMNTRVAEMVQDERDRIDQERANCQALAAKVRNTISRMQSFPKGKSLISWAIIINTILFFAGVICPITFLPTDGMPVLARFKEYLPLFFDGLLSLRGIMVAVVSLGFVAFQILFFIKNKRQFYSEDVILEMKRFAKLDGYSEHFGAYEEHLVISRMSKT